MSPEASADLDQAAHDASTRALAVLLAHAVELARTAEIHESHHRIGPLHCKVLSNDSEAATRLTRCLVAEGTERVSRTDLTISVLSGTAAPYSMPPPWNLPHSSARHLERLHLAPDNAISAFYDHDRRFWLMLDRPKAQGLLWIADTRDIPFWEEAAPFKLLLNWFLADSELAIVHGGVVADTRNGLLLVGPGGSGKSTTVAACFQAGLGVCGDDLVLTERSGSAWRAHALYDSVKLAPDGRIAVPPLLDRAPSRPCGDKRLVRYSDADSSRFVRQVPLCAIAQCVITGEPASALRPQSPAALLRALAPPTVFLLRGRESETLRKIGALVRGLPCFRLELGRDTEEAAVCVARWLAERPA